MAARDPVVPALERIARTLRDRCSAVRFGAPVAAATVAMLLPSRVDVYRTATNLTLCVAPLGTLAVRRLSDVGVAGAEPPAASASSAKKGPEIPLAKLPTLPAIELPPPTKPAVENLEARYPGVKDVILQDGRVRPGHGGGDRGIVAQIRLHRGDLADIAHRPARQQRVAMFAVARDGIRAVGHVVAVGREVARLALRRRREVAP